MPSSTPTDLPLTIEHIDALKLLSFPCKLAYSAPGKNHQQITKHRERFAELFVKFKDEPSCSDLTICCKGREWRVHRVIVCAHSEYFKDACEQAGDQSLPQQISLDDEDVSTIERLVTYFYSLDYDDTRQDPLLSKDHPMYDVYDPAHQPLTVNALMYVAATKFMIPALEQRAVDKTPVPFAHYKDFSNAVRIVWTSISTSDRTLREYYLKLLCEPRYGLNVFKRSALMDARGGALADFRAAGDFLLDVVKADTEHLASLHRRVAELENIVEGDC